MDPLKAFEEEKRRMIAAQGADEPLREVTRDWFLRSTAHRYSYVFTWMGVPIIQYPQDIVALQELVWTTRPELIIETGIAHGGSLMLSASLLELIGGNGRVVGIDVDIRAHNRAVIEAHPLMKRITLIEGSSTDPAIVREVSTLARGRSPVLVILDSNHTHEHVAGELRAYSPLVTKGSYLIVFDTVIDDMPPDAFPDRPWGPRNNPKTAVREFLRDNHRFVVDAEFEGKLLITVAPEGYLRCVGDLPMKRISVSGPWITAKEIEYVADAAANAWYENANVYHKRFEQAFASRHGVRHAVSLPSCTSAIHLSLLALGVGPGDEVIVPDLTWIASVAPVSYVGATPVFADVDRETWCLAVESVKEVVTPRTKAIIPVDLYGSMPDMNGLREVASRAGVAIIEDAAEAIGSKYDGLPSGTFGDTGVFSFHGSKTVTTGEGGMLVTNRDDLLKRVMVLRDHGRQPGDTTFVNTEVAFKYKMSALQAALGLAQIERLDELIERKRQIFGWYKEALGRLEGIKLNSEPPNVINSYWMVTVIVDPERGLDKTKLILLLSERGIDCRPIFSPLSSLPAYANHPSREAAKARNKVSYALGPYGVNLPSGFNVDRETVQYVADSLRSVLAG